MKVRSEESPSRPGRRFTAGLIAIAALGLALRLAFVIAVPTRPIEDFWSYHLRSESLWERGEYAAIAGRPDASYPPGYPLLLAPIHASSNPLAVAKLLNVLLGTATILLAGAAGKSLWGSTAGLVAAGLVAIDPRAVAVTGVLASENLFAPLLLAWVFLWSRSTGRERSPGLAVGAGVVLGLLTLARSIGWLLGVLWPIGSWLAGKRGRAILAETLVLLLVQHAVLLPWALRNQVTLGRFTVLSSVGGIDLFIGNSEPATGGWYFWRPELERVRPGSEKLSVFELDDAAGEAALGWMRRNPRRALALYRDKLAHILFNDEKYALHYSVSGRGNAIPDKGVEVVAGPHPLKDHAASVLRFLTAFQRALFGLGLLGGVLLLGEALRRRSPRPAAQAAVLLGGAAYFVVLAAVFHASTRLRWPAMDLLRLAAALPLAFAFRLLLPARWSRRLPP